MLSDCCIGKMLRGTVAGVESKHMFEVTETEVVDLPGERLEAELTTLAAHLHSGMCRVLLMRAGLEPRGLYESWECRGTSLWLTGKCGVAARTAREHVHVARALEKLPLATAAFGRGELSYAKVRAMARVVDVLPEEQLMEMATTATAGQLERILGTFHHHHRNQTRSPEKRQGMGAWWDDEQTMLEFKGLLSTEEAEILLAAMATMRKRRQASRNGSAEPLSEVDVFDPEVLQRRTAEDLVDMARAVLRMTDSDGPPVQAGFHADLDLMLGLPDPGGAWREGAPPLPADIVRRLGCDASWRLVIED